jgi:hypothetical protein
VLCVIQAPRGNSEKLPRPLIRLLWQEEMSWRQLAVVEKLALNALAEVNEPQKLPDLLAYGDVYYLLQTEMEGWGTVADITNQVEDMRKALPASSLHSQEGIMMRAVSMP